MGKNLLFNWWTPKGYLCHLIAIIFSFLQKQTNRFYLALCVLTLILLPLFYLIVFLHQRFALCTLWISTFLMRWAFPGLFSYSAMQGNEERCPGSKTVFKNWAEEKTILVVSYLCVPKHPTDVCTILFVASIYTVVLEHLLYFYELFRSVGTLDHQTLSNASMNCQNHFIGFKLP